MSQRSDHRDVATSCGYPMSAHGYGAVCPRNRWQALRNRVRPGNWKVLGWRVWYWLRASASLTDTPRGDDHARRS